ncbi:MAG: hypothetical protein U1C50_02400, partial [Patescibacteria group bacterium]|nr:hypothetical protein [Patescibacteria group bacterium]
TSRAVQVLNVGYNPTSLKLRGASKKILKKTNQAEIDKCPQCGTKMFKAEGCATCPSCAFSVCSL